VVDESLFVQTGLQVGGGGAMLQDLPDISDQIAQAIRSFRVLVDRSRKYDLPSAKDRRTMELVDLWLEIQREEAMSACPPKAEECTRAIVLEG
jgi:hypothetical protein